MTLFFFILFFTIVLPTPRLTLFPYHDALPISIPASGRSPILARCLLSRTSSASPTTATSCGCPRSEEHTSELPSLRHLVSRLLLEKKKDSSIQKCMKCISSADSDDKSHRVNEC